MCNVYSVLVAYNPEEGQLESAIERLLEQVEFVVICNNSSTSFHYEHDLVKVFNFNANFGIAYAQNVGMRWAIENGSDYILQMDQDSILEANTVKNLLKSYKNLTAHNVGLIGPLHFDKVLQEVDYKRLPKGKLIPSTNCEFVQETISSASLIPVHVFKKVGFMEEELFIDLVDWEFCWRLIEHGFTVVRDNDIKLPHRVGNGTQKLVGNLDARIPAPIRHYYHTRNSIVLLNRSYVPLKFKLETVVKTFSKIILYPFCFEDGKHRVKYILKGVGDAVLRKLGKYSYD